MTTVEIKLRERVKELKCLYELSHVALAAADDVSAVLEHTLKILPQAMQFPDLAEVCIVMKGVSRSTQFFHRSSNRISSRIGLRGKQYGTVRIGYRIDRGKRVAGRFLPEEKNLLKIVAGELSLCVERAAAQESNRKLGMQLLHSERLAFVGGLSAGIAHELNEPLGRILGFAQLVKAHGGLSDQQSLDIDRIVKASLYTREIIKKLMIFSRQMPRQLSMVNLNAVILNILYFIDVRFQSRGIQIKQRLDAQLPGIEADAVQLSQVLVNLVTNAIHALDDGGTVSVITGTRRGRVVLTVSDTGCGMTAEVKQRIFEPFFTTKPVGQGTGLGLSVVQGIVEEHGGKISVSSTPGKGSKFEVVLPLKQQ